MNTHTVRKCPAARILELWGHNFTPVPPSVKCVRPPLGARSSLSYHPTRPKYFVIFVGSFSNEKGLTMINNKKFANLLQLMTLTIMSHLTSPYYYNSYVNEQKSNFNSNSRHLKLTAETRLQSTAYTINFVLRLLLTTELYNIALGFYGRHMTQQKETVIT